MPITIKFLRGFGLPGSFLLAMSSCACPASAQETGEPLTPALLQSRITSVEGSTEIDDATKARLIQLYRQVIAYLDEARSNRRAAEGFREAGERSPVEANAIQTAMESMRRTDPTQDLQQDLAAMPPDALDRALQEELARRATVEAELRALDVRLEAETVRPGRIRERLAAARSLVEGITGQPGLPRVPDENPLLAEASRWSSDMQLQALQSEIAMLDQELLSHDERIELLRAQRDETALRATRIGERIEAVLAAINAARQDEAELAETQARATLQTASGVDPVVQDLAEANLALVEQLRQQVRALETLSERENRIRPQVDRLAKTFRSTRRRLQLADSDAPSGLAIRVQRQQLPGVKVYTRERRDVHRAITSVSLRRLGAAEERGKMEDLDAYVAARVAEAEGGPLEPGVLADLEDLSRTRKSLLDRLLAGGLTLQERLYGLDDLLSQLAERTEAYDDYLAKRLVWVRSVRAIDSDALAALPGEVSKFVSPAEWRHALSSAARRMVRTPVLLIGGLIALGLLLRRSRIRLRLAETGKDVGRVVNDRMSTTFSALAYTLLLALPAPLLLLTVGQAMTSAPDATSFSAGLALGLMRAGGLLLLLLLIRVLCEPDGMAELHFGQARLTLAPVHRHLGWLIGMGLPLYFVAWSVSTINPATAGGTLGLLSLVGLNTTLAVFVVGVARPRQRLVHRKWRYLFMSLALGTLVGISALALVGFTHTAVELLQRLTRSAVLLAAAWLVRALVQRWLLMTRQRLISDASIARPDGSLHQQPTKATEEGGQEAPGDDIGGPQVDLMALDSDSRKLLNAAMTLVVALGLAGIWGGMIPALGILTGVKLWSKVVVVDGVDQQIPVTLGHLLVAAAIAIGGAITAKNLPSLLNMLLLKRDQVSAGGRYAAETLTRYAIVGLTVLLVLGRLGASWSQMGWAAAALGLGIGFGVQEIVANFICGLILLFERPVRVGDVVTIGDASGTVTKIRIRATTLRDWDQKELVVPNKELITGRLLNWTLSDAVIRILVPVGVAYGSNVERALELMLEAAEENENVLEEPRPMVTFEQFGNSSLNLSLRAYIGSFPDRWPTITALHRAIDQKFREAEIVIAFPQRDVHHYEGRGRPDPAELHQPQSAKEEPTP